MAEKSIRDSSLNVGDVILFADSRLKGRTATIIAVDPYDTRYPCLAGWKEEDDIPEGEYTAPSGTTIPAKAKRINNIDIYTKRCWLYHGTLISIALSPISKDGMRCAGKGCGTFNPYAQPNMPNDVYMCYSCRQRPSYMR